MGDYSKNPERPFEVRVPNKIRKRIAMHHAADIIISEKKEALTQLRKLAALPAIAVAKKTGSMWSRFTGGIKKFWGTKNAIS